jgi:hypothetical protein
MVIPYIKEGACESNRARGLLEGSPHQRRQDAADYWSYLE